MGEVYSTSERGCFPMLFNVLLVFGVLNVLFLLFSNEFLLQFLLLFLFLFFNYYSYIELILN